MIYKSRKLGEEINRNIQLGEDGVLYMKDGSSVDGYLESFMKNLQDNAGVGSNISVCVVPSDLVEKFEEAAIMNMAHGC